MRKNIAIFASGEGSNARKIISKTTYEYDVKLIVTDNPNSGVIEIAKENNIFHFVWGGEDITDFLKKCDIQLIVLAGYLKKIPKYLTDSFKVINIHPSLLPKYGGKGMYGMNVHKKVIESGDMKSGITIHFVNEKYDDGEIIAQKDLTLMKNETPESLQQRIKTLEHAYYSFFINLICINL
jgi:phosphoribosylglycinamide formyltransferase-1